MSRSRPSSKALTPVGALLSKSPELARRRDRVDTDSFRRAVGERIADRARPGAIRDGVLTIYVASSVWAQELSLLSTTIRERLVAAGFEVTELRFRVGDVSKHEAPSAGVAKTVEPVQRVPTKAALPDDLVARLDGIEDRALANSIAEAASYALAREKELTSKRRAPRSPRSDGERSDPPAPSPAPGTGARKDTGGRR